MQEDIIYVVYFDGKRYEKEGLKIAYLNKSYTKQIITTEAKNKVKDKYDEEVTSKSFKYWYELTEELQKVLIDEMKERFMIVEYKPCL